MRLQSLLRRWKDEGIALLPPESAQSIEATFSKVGSRVTHETTELYSALGGMAEMDREYLRLWSLKEVEEENTTESEFGVLFADYLINSWCFRLRPINTETSAVYIDRFDNQPPELVTESLSEFFAIYEREPQRVHAL